MRNLNKINVYDFYDTLTNLYFIFNVYFVLVFIKATIMHKSYTNNNEIIHLNNFTLFVEKCLSNITYHEIFIY
jgi:hypothetical protein